MSTILIYPQEKIPEYTIVCEATTPGLNFTRRDVKSVEIYCKLYCVLKLIRNYYNSDSPNTTIQLGGSLNESNIVENSDVYFECL